MAGRALPPVPARGAVWVVDVAGGRLLRANRQGLSAFGLLPGTALPVSLDRTMPALRTISRLSTSQQIIESEPLLFWTAIGPAACRCRLQFFDLPPVGRICEIWTMDIPAEAKLARTLKSDAAEPITAAVDTAPVMEVAQIEQTRDPPPNDLATMQEIARRIRQGRKGMTLSGLSEAVQDGGAQGSTVVPFDQSMREPQPSASPGQGVAAASRPGVAAQEAMEAAVRPASGSPTEDPLRTVSHEIRTPLAAIVSLAEVIRDAHLGPVGDVRYRDYAGDIAASARHALAVVDAVLGASGTLSEEEFVFTEVDVAEIMAQCRAMVAPLAQQAQLEVTTDVPAAVPRIIADIRSLKQILLNLLSNAIKFTPGGGRVALAATYQPGGPVEISVTDTGPGMSPSELAAAGRRRTTARTATGSGMGLAIAMELARRNGAALNLTAGADNGLAAKLTISPSRLVPV